MSFISLGIDADICEALDSRGITSPFPIQEQAIPVALSGTDVIGQAKTGTGKTLGFGLPMLQALGKDPEPGVQALVVVPTRELAVQVASDLELASANRSTQVVAIYGGKAYEGQIEAIKSGAQVVVGTPGRLIDLSKQKLLDLSKIKFMVLDEADEMLDLGFLPDVEKLFSYTPAGRQTMLFSATMPAAILSLARRYQNRPIHIRVSDPEEGKTKADIKQFVYRAHALDKDEVVGRILQAEGRGKTVIFVRTKRHSAKLTEELVDRGFMATPLHGDMNQEARERSMQAFRTGKKDILVATEVAARGIDVDDVTHVINYSVPEDEKAYLHRVGRTGRAGKLGIAVTFVDWEDMVRWVHINRELDMGIPEPVETYSNSEHLYSDLGIAPESKGRLKRKSEEPKANTGKPGGHSGQRHQRSDRDKAKGGDMPHKDVAAASPQRNRNRRRNYKNASTPEA
ncbi:MAG: DEAD/DEAH box helicase [Aquiluna sp.]|nr:DEAD/DEAH box helicase [Aquiluna sp.]MCF8546100.1 DEAD/DEAH box helicase [Aquiluna sp.]